MQTIPMASFSTALFMSFLSFALFLQPLLSRSHVAHPQTNITTTSSTAATTYIIHADNFSRPSHLATQTQWYSSILQSLSSTNTTTPTKTHSHNIIYAYDTILHGFAAILSSEEAESVSEIPGVVGVYKDTVMQLHTTRSPDFLGLNHDFGLWPESNFGEDVIIGLVDTGIWPESKSFNDDGLPDVPSRWKGECESGERFGPRLCNKKLIGARWFLNGTRSLGLLDSGDRKYFRSPRDDDGHGTHTSSTAAGSPVPNATFFGFANGTARGMAPRARLAMYKACWPLCLLSDILAAMDSAVKDGVDILSLSLGSDAPQPLDVDLLAIGAFNAVRRGIFVVCSAGNSGHFISSVTNVAPWITTVGAGSIDRQFPASITLGDGTVIVGMSLYREIKPMNTSFRPLVHVPYCSAFTLVPRLVRGKIVVCSQVENYDVGPTIQDLGGAGLIWGGDPIFGTGGITPLAFTLPALTVDYLDEMKIMAYMNMTSTSKPKARFELPQRTILGENRAPMVADFSSRGPNAIVPEILKPDILAPGINILAAWSPEVPLMDGLKLRGKFNILSGTSMSCPHVAGVAALLRQAHRDWSPAMIRSALMTTAAVVDNQYRPILDEGMKPMTALAFGAGHVYPPLARDPGLVYDAGVQDYIDLLCAMNYTEEQLRKFGVGKADCSTFVIGAGNLNYPSFVVIFGINGTNVKVAKRTLTMVSDLPEVYVARVVNPRPDKVEVRVEPESLEFEMVNEKRSYVVKFMSKVVYSSVEEYGYIIWENDVHQVKSPVVFMWELVN